MGRPPGKAACLIISPSLSLNEVQPFRLLMPFRWHVVGPNAAAVKASLSSRDVPGRRGIRRETRMSLEAVLELSLPCHSTAMTPHAAIFVDQA